LGGTLGIFGKKQESVIIQQIEQSLKEKSPQKTILNLISLIPKTLLPDTPSPVVETAIADDPILLLIGVSPQEIKTLKTHPLPSNWTIKKVSTLKQARLFLEESLIGAIILDMESLSSKDQGLTFLEELSQKWENLPFIVLDTQNDLTYRLKIANLGKGRFVAKPITGDRLFQALNSLLYFDSVRDIKLMLVDDDPDFLGILTVILTPFNFNLVTVSDPQTFWPVLEETKPDLLVLDIEMPHFNGFNLCKVVRQDDRFHYLPILFISGHSDPSLLRQALSVGGDDYIQKSNVTEELIPRLFHHLPRRK
jgi:DNA-binding response OmpR family regulator